MLTTWRQCCCVSPAAICLAVAELWLTQKLAFQVIARGRQWSDAVDWRTSLTHLAPAQAYIIAAVRSARGKVKGCRHETERTFTTLFQGFEMPSPKLTLWQKLGRNCYSQGLVYWQSSIRVQADLFEQVSIRHIATRHDNQMHTYRKPATALEVILATMLAS